MKFDADRATVRDATTILKTFLGEKGRVTLPSLAGVRLTAHDGDRLTLEATDLETSLTLTVPATVATPGTTLVPRADLHKLLAGKYDTVTVADDDDDSVTVHGAGTATVRTLILEDFPALPTSDDGAPYDTLTPSDMDTVRRVCHAASTDDARPVLTGALLDGHEIAATDSYRLAVGKLDGSVTPAGTPNRDSEEPSGNNVPARVLHRLAKLNTDGASVVVRPEDGQVTFSLCAYAGPKKDRRQVGVQLTSRTIEGTFPNYGNLWPDTEEGATTVAPSDLAGALDAVKHVTDGSANTPVMLAGTDDGRIRVHAASTAVGTAEAHAATVSTSGEPLDVAFNRKFLAAGLTAVTYDGCPVRLGYRDSLKPAIFTSDGPVSVLLMPMRVHT